MGSLLLGRAAAVAAVIAAGLTGCGKPAATTASPTASTPTTSTASVQSARLTKWIDLKPGDCLAEAPPTDPAVVTVTVVDCAGPHLAEAFLRANVPVNAALTGTASQACGNGLTDYTGLPAGNAAYSITYLIDSDQDRTSNNPYPSTVICLLQSPTGKPLTGSAKR